MTNESTHVPSEVRTPRRNPRPIHPHLSEGTQLPREERTDRITTSHSRARQYKERIFRPDEEKSARNILTNTTTEPTHKI